MSGQAPSAQATLLAQHLSVGLSPKTGALGKSAPGRACCCCCCCLRATFLIRVMLTVQTMQAAGAASHHALHARSPLSFLRLPPFFS